ncbi:MAG TPA: glycosyltransferase [Candidatus Omnitrophota bacterium]|nr:glycosyltransferase [Candidatus Omnitrophota bacterium]
MIPDRSHFHGWLKDPEKRTVLFLGTVVVLTLIAVWLVSSAIVMTEDTVLLSLAWIFGFGFLFFNVAYLFLTSAVHPFLKTPILKEDYVKRFPKVALVYPIRNESYGMSQRMNYSFSGNKFHNVDLWILSDSAEEYAPYEANLVAKLESLHPGRVFYRRRPHPVERKQGNIAEFLHSHPEYDYLYICDADGMVPKGTLLKLLRKAEHPENQDIAIFQAFVRIAHATTWYSRFERIGTRFAQRLNFVAVQAIFGRTISFGHHHLARTKAISKIRLPKGLLSHDNWDTVRLDQMGYRVAFCPDVEAYDEAPSNYLEAKARASRWAQGTLQGVPLLFESNVTLASKFLAGYGIYLYLADIVFFFWVLLGLLSHSLMTGELIYFRIDSIWMNLFSNQILKWILLFSLAVVFLHKAVILKTWEDVRHYLYELLISTLVTLNNFIYSPLAILSIPLKKLHWRPMAKNPFATVDFPTATRSLWIGTAFGFLGLYFCTKLTPYFVWQTTPILISLIFSIPTVYFTAKSIPAKLRSWI